MGNFIVTARVAQLIAIPEADLSDLRVFKCFGTYTISKPNRLESAVHWLACLLRFENEITDPNQIIINNKIDSGFVAGCRLISNHSPDNKIKEICKKFISLSLLPQQDLANGPSSSSASKTIESAFDKEMKKKDSVFEDSGVGEFLEANYKKTEAAPLINNETKMLAAIQKDPHCILYIGPQLFTANFFERVIDIQGNNSNKIITQSFNILCESDNKVFKDIFKEKENQEIILKIFKKTDPMDDNSALMKSIPNYLGDKEFVEKCLTLPYFERNFLYLFKFIQPPLSNNKEFMEEHLKNDARIIKYAGADLLTQNIDLLQTYLTDLSLMNEFFIELDATEQWKLALPILIGNKNTPFMDWCNSKFQEWNKDSNDSRYIRQIKAVIDKYETKSNE